MRRGLLLGAIACGAAGAIFAEDKPATSTKPAEASEDSIAAARREYETIKALRDPALQPKGDVPRLSVPELQSPSAPGAWSPAKKTPEDGKKSANWLVDAMEKPTSRDARDPRKDRERSGKTDRERTLTSTDQDKVTSDDANQPDAVPRDNAAEADQKKSAAAANPLTRYLGEWMTAKDYALLKPGLDQADLKDRGSSSGALPNSTTAFGATSLPGSDTAFGLVPGNATPAIPAAPRENPFLQSLNPPPPPVYTPPVNVATVPSNMGQTTPAAPVIEPPRSKIPDFVKPASEEKYFKQLKRF